VPAAVKHGDDSFLYIGSNDEINEKVILDSNTEAYGFGGNHFFWVRPSWGRNKPGTVKIDGGEACHTISTLFDEKASEGIQCVVTGGGPEKDYIHGGKGNDFIYVENDEVSDVGGENTFLVTGSGVDDITLEPGINVIIIDKISGSIEMKASGGNTRIVYQGDALTAEGTLNSGKFTLHGGDAHHDVLSMIKYHPISLPSDPPERMVVFFYDSDSITVKYYFDKIDKVADHLFETLDAQEALTLIHSCFAQRPRKVNTSSIETSSGLNLAGIL